MFVFGTKICGWVSPSSALLRLTHHSQVDMLFLRYKFVNFEKETGPTTLVGPNRQREPGMVGTEGERAELHVIIAELPFTLEHLKPQPSSSSMIFSLLHSHVNLDWCDEIKLSNLLQPTQINYQCTIQHQTSEHRHTRPTHTQHYRTIKHRTSVNQHTHTCFISTTLAPQHRTILYF